MRTTPENAIIIANISYFVKDSLSKINANNAVIIGLVQNRTAALDNAIKDIAVKRKQWAITPKNALAIKVGLIFSLISKKSIFFIVKVIMNSMVAIVP